MQRKDVTDRKTIGMIRRIHVTPFLLSPQPIFGMLPWGTASMNDWIFNKRELKHVIYVSCLAQNCVHRKGWFSYVVMESPNGLLIMFPSPRPTRK